MNPNYQKLRGRCTLAFELLRVPAILSSLSCRLETCKFLNQFLFWHFLLGLKNEERLQVRHKGDRFDPHDLHHNSQKSIPWALAQWLKSTPV